MKTIFPFILLIFSTLIACNDGNLTIESISFEGTNAYSCAGNTQPNFLYKTQGSQALILSFDSRELPEKEGVTIGEIPTKFKLIYRNFDGSPSQNYFCTTPPSSSPKVLSEIEAKGGNVKITTKKTISSNGNEKINHLITIEDLVIFNNNGEQLIDSNFIFGNYQPKN